MKSRRRNSLGWAFLVYLSFLCGGLGGKEKDYAAGIAEGRSEIHSLRDLVLSGEYHKAKRPLEVLVRESQTGYVRALGCFLLARTLYEVENQEAIPPVVRMAEQGVSQAMASQEYSDEERTELTRGLLDCVKLFMRLPWDRRKKTLFFLDAAEKLCPERHGDLLGEIFYKRGLYHYQSAPFEERAFAQAGDSWKRFLQKCPEHPRFAEACLFLSEIAGLQGDRQEEANLLQACLSPAAMASPRLRKLAQRRLAFQVHPRASLHVPSQAQLGQTVSFRIQGRGPAELAVCRCESRFLFDRLPRSGQLWEGFGSDHVEETVLEIPFHLDPLQAVYQDISIDKPGFYGVSLRLPNGGIIQTCMLVSQTVLVGWRFQDRVLLWVVDAVEGQPCIGTRVWLREGRREPSREIGVTDREGFIEVPLETQRNLLFLTCPSIGPAVLALEPLASPSGKGGLLFAPPEVAYADSTVDVIAFAKGDLLESRMQEMELVDPTGLPIVSTTFHLVEQARFRGEIALPSWLPPGTYGLRRKQTQDLLYPWFGCIEVAPLSRKASHMALSHETGWVQKGETVHMQGRCLAGRAGGEPLAKQEILYRLFREKRDTFCSPQGPFSTFYAGGDLEVEGKTVSDEDGSFAVDFPTHAHGKDEVYRLEARTPWGAGGAAVVYAMKRPYISTIELNENILMAGDVCKGCVVVRDPLGSPVSGVALDVSASRQGRKEIVTEDEGRASFFFENFETGRHQVNVKGGAQLAPSEEEIVVLPASGSLKAKNQNSGIVSSSRPLQPGKDFHLFAWHGSAGPGACVLRSGGRLALRQSVPPGGALFRGVEFDRCPVLVDFVFVEDGRLQRESLWIPVLSESSEGGGFVSERAKRHVSMLEERIHRRGFARLLGSSNREWASPIRAHFPEEPGRVPSSPITVSTKQEWSWIPERMGEQPVGITGRWLAGLHSSEKAMREQMSRSGLFPADSLDWEMPPTSREREVEPHLAGRARYVGCVHLEGSSAQLILDPSLSREGGDLQLHFGPRLSEICAARLKPLDEVLIREERLLFLLLLSLDSSDLMDGLSFFQSIDGGWRWPGEEKADPLLTCLFLATPVLQNEGASPLWTAEQAYTYLKEREGEAFFEEYRESVKLLLGRWKMDRQEGSERPTLSQTEALSVRIWGPLADPLRSICSLEPGGILGDVQRCASVAMDPEKDPLVRALWCLAVRRLERPGERSGSDPARLQVNGFNLDWQQTQMEGVHTARVDTQSFLERLILECEDALSGWVVATYASSDDRAKADDNQKGTKPCIGVEFWQGGNRLQASDTVLSLRKGALVERRICVDFPVRYDRFLLHDTYPIGLLPAGDWQMDGDPSRANFGHRGLSIHLEGCEPGLHQFSYRLVAEHRGRSTHEGTWLLAWGPTSTEGYAPPMTIQIH